MMVRGQHHAPAALPQPNNLGDNWIGGCLAPESVRTFRRR